MNGRKQLIVNLKPGEIDLNDGDFVIIEKYIRNPEKKPNADI